MFKSLRNRQLTNKLHKLLGHNVEYKGNERIVGILVHNEHGFAIKSSGKEYSIITTRALPHISNLVTCIIIGKSTIKVDGEIVEQTDAIIETIFYHMA